MGLAGGGIVTWVLSGQSLAHARSTHDGGETLNVSVSAGGSGKAVVVVFSTIFLVGLLLFVLGRPEFPKESAKQIDDLHKSQFRSQGGMTDTPTTQPQQPLVIGQPLGQLGATGMAAANLTTSPPKKPVIGLPISSGADEGQNKLAEPPNGGQDDEDAAN
jgi:hypothetical protein